MTWLFLAWSFVSVGLPVSVFVFDGFTVKPRVMVWGSQVCVYGYDTEECYDPLVVVPIQW